MTDVLRRAPIVVALLAAATVLAACTPSGSAPAAGSSVPGSSVTGSSAAGSSVTGSSVTGSSVAATPTPAGTAPVVAGPTTSATAADCPYATRSTVMKIMGMRLSHVTALRSGGRTVGCRFYPVGRPDAQCDASCLKAEHLPPPTQPAVEITTQRFASPTIAHNAFVRTAERGTNVQQVTIGPGTGLCFQTAFYRQDHGTDYACAISSGTTELLVRTVDTTGTLSTSAVTKAALGAR